MSVRVCTSVATAVLLLAVAGCSQPATTPGASARTSADAGAGHVTPKPRPVTAHRNATKRPASHPSPATRRPAHAARAARARPPAERVLAAGVPAAAVPITRLTPGAALTTDARTVCVSGYSSRVRDVSGSTKDAVYARYHVVHVPYAHEVDHLVSLELGGSNAITNLWPEPYAGVWGARTKDVLENRLHALVCSGALRLRHAQRIEAADWVTAYRRYVGAAPASAPIVRPAVRPTVRPAVRPAVRGACETGYSPCLPQVSDLNCDDIPADKRPVRVTGSDPYGLDADGNGIGCSS